MHFVDKGNNCQYLKCDKSGRLNTCKAKTVRYDEMEHLFFSHFEELDIKSLLPNNTEIEIEINEVKRKNLFLNNQIEDYNRQITNGTNTLLNEDAAEIRTIIVEQIKTLKTLKETAETELNGVASKLNELTSQKVDISNSVALLNNLKQVFEKTENEQEKIVIREKIRGQIRTLVDRIEIFPVKDRNAKIPVLSDDVIATRIYKSLNGITIHLKNKVQVRMLVGIDYKEKGSSSEKLTAHRLDRKPKYN